MIKALLVIMLFCAPVFSEEGVVSEIEFDVYTATYTGTHIFGYAPPTSLTFGSNEEGKMTWKKGYLEFEGKADESAKSFFDYLKKYVDAYIREECKEKNEPTNKVPIRKKD